MSLYEELRRRHVLRVGAAYAVVAWLLIQIAETIFPLFGFDETPARIVVVVLAVGFIPAMVLAWAFELTPEGLRKERDIDRNIATPRAGKGLDRVIMSGLALALAYFAIDKFVVDPARDESEMETAVETAAQQARIDALLGSYGDQSIAVLPFVNMSADPDQAYFADGMAEELINLLANIPELRVISRSSSFAFRGREVDIPEIARKLNVAHVLEGSVRTSGNRIRVTAQLIEAGSDTHLWSQSFERDMDDIFRIQDEIAATVVAQLEIRLLGPAPSSTPTDPETYTLYIKGRDLIAKNDRDALERAVPLLQQVLERDPDYVPALTRLAMAKTELGRFLSPNPLDFDPRTLQEVAALLHRALERDPDYALANAGYAGLLLIFERDLERAATHMTAALANGPANPEVLRVGSVFARYIGRFEDNLRLAQRAARLDPMCGMCLFTLSQAYLQAGRYDEAEAALRYFQAFKPQAGRYRLGLIKLLQGEPAAALAIFDEQPGNDSFWQSARALALHDLGRSAEFERTVARVRDSAGPSDPFAVARVHAWTGDADAAFASLDTALAQDIGLFRAIVWDPVFNHLHDDPRWLGLRRQVGLGPEALARVDFHVP